MGPRRADPSDEPRLLTFMESIDHAFKPKLSARVSLEQWTRKILDLGTVLVSGEGEKLLGVIAFYCNDKKSRRAFISFLGVDESARRQGLGRRLLHEALRICRRERMQQALVATDPGNAAAIALYQAAGFAVDEGESERSGKTALSLTL